MTLHEKINQRQRITIPSQYTLYKDGVFYTVSVSGKKPEYFPCCNQWDGPKNQPQITEAEIPAIHKAYREQRRLHDKYNHYRFDKQIHLSTSTH